MRDAAEDKARKERLSLLHSVEKATTYTKYTLVCVKCKERFYENAECGPMGLELLDCDKHYKCPGCNTATFIDEEECRDALNNQ